jgi:hypothetical protein
LDRNFIGNKQNKNVETCTILKNFPLIYKKFLAFRVLYDIINCKCVISGKYLRIGMELHEIFTLPSRISTMFRVICMIILYISHMK